MKAYQLHKCELILLHLIGFDFSNGYYQDDIDQAIDENKGLWLKILTLDDTIKGK